MKVALIGYGYMGAIYTTLCKALKWEIIGIHDIKYDEAKFASLAFYPDRKALIAHPEVEVVVICTPHKHHLSVLKQCLAQGKNVILEKPIAGSIEETEETYTLIEANKEKCIVVVNITHCFYDNIVAAKSKLSQYVVNDIETITDRITFPIFESERYWWLFKKEAVDHGVLLTNGCHQLARILYLLSEYEPTLEVMGGISANTNRLGDIEDSAAHVRLNIILSGGKKIPLNILVDWPMAKDKDEQIQESIFVHMKSGLLQIQAWQGITFHPSKERKIPYQVPFNRTTINEQIERGLKNVLLAFEEAASKKLTEKHYSVKYAYQAEVAIDTFYKHFQQREITPQHSSLQLRSLGFDRPISGNTRYADSEQSALAKALDLISPNKLIMKSCSL